MDEYKKKLNDLAFSEPIYKKIEDIGNRHDLNLDQMGELAAEIRDVITEAVPSTEFTKELKDRLEVDEDKAIDITADVDNEIFKYIKSLMEQLTEVSQIVNTPPAPKKVATKPVTQAAPAIAPIEKAGDFKVINSPAPSSSPLYNDHTLNREDVLADLENIKNLQPEKAETYVEHLLEPVPAPTAPPPPPPKPVTPPPQIPQQPRPEGKKYEEDPYREPI
jgi:hypothetical protein